MIVKIDIRETALIEQMQRQISSIPVFKNIQLILETLPIGDIIINDENVDRIIIERKTINDLLSSIKDGRYEEQSYRLNGLNHHNHNIIYLIEGDVNKVNRFKVDSGIEKLTLYSAMFSLNYYKGFSVFRSFSLDETANIICNMAYKIGKDLTKKSYFQNNNIQNNNIQNNNIQNENSDNEINKSVMNVTSEQNELTEKDYINVVKKIKKDNITPDNIGEIMLCQIPGVSSVTALAIMEKYKTISNLIKEINLDKDCLKEMCYTNSKGQIRKINKSSILNIIKFIINT
jgi:ERCC4-type nuclease